MRLRAIPLLTLLSLLAACGEDEDDTDSGGGTGGADLLWYTTCGDPVCSGYSASAHSNAPCTSQAEAAACTPAGAGCDLQDECNAELICATEDPKDQEGGCPISLASAKADIHYLSGGERARLHAAVLDLRLADWRYKSEAPGGQHHVGFLIDDLPAGSPAMRPSGERVDLYGYTSMAVAALQVQDARIAAQQATLQAQAARIAALEARLAALEAPAR